MKTLKQLRQEYEAQGLKLEKRNHFAYAINEELVTKYEETLLYTIEDWIEGYDWMHDKHDDKHELYIYERTGIFHDMMPDIEIIRPIKKFVFEIKGEDGFSAKKQAYQEAEYDRLFAEGLEKHKAEFLEGYSASINKARYLEDAKNDAIYYYNECRYYNDGKKTTYDIRPPKSSFFFNQEREPMAVEKVAKIAFGAWLEQQTYDSLTTPQPNVESHFSVLEWATIFYYADETKLLADSRIIKTRLKQFMSKHQVNTTFDNFKTKYYEAKKRINVKEDYPTNKLKLIIPFLKENYKQTVTKVENDITILEENKSEY